MLSAPYLYCLHLRRVFVLLILQLFDFVVDPIHRRAVWNIAGVYHSTNPAQDLPGAPVSNQTALTAPENPCLRREKVGTFHWLCVPLFLFKNVMTFSLKMPDISYTFSFKLTFELWLPAKFVFSQEVCKRSVTDKKKCDGMHKSDTSTPCTVLLKTNDYL